MKRDKCSVSDAPVGCQVVSIAPAHKHSIDFNKSKPSASSMIRPYYSVPPPEPEASTQQQPHPFADLMPPRGAHSWDGALGGSTALANSVVWDRGLSQAHGFRVGLKTITTISLSMFTVVPALTLWLLSWQSGTEGVNTMQALGQTSVEEVSFQLRSSLISSAAASVVKLVTQAEALMNCTLNLVESQGTQRLPGSMVSLATMESYTPFVASSLKAINQFSMFTVGAITNFVLAPSGNVRGISQYNMFAKFHYDLLADLVRLTIYLGSYRLNDQYQNATSAYTYAVNQSTGSPVLEMLRIDFRFTFMMEVNLSQPVRCNWSEMISFQPALGVPIVALECTLLVSDHQAALRYSINTNIYSVSNFLRSLLNGPKERLFVSFRNTYGHLIGASHGKFFSHSDQIYNDPDLLKNPPPIRDFRPYTALQSNDLTIQQAAVWLLNQYGNWGNIPEISVVQELQGTNGTEFFWVATEHITTEFNLRLEVYLLVDRASRMGPIEQTKDRTLQHIRTTNTQNIVILVCLLAGALGSAMLISIFLTRSLRQLASGMDMLSMLEFEETYPSLLCSSSRYSEVHKCERSFVALERGLKAFVKYVPKDVVKKMLMGEMESGQLMTRRMLTVLFMDIVGFSTLCEKVAVDALNRLTMEYLQAMCEVIVMSGGTLDKFIGDCIMAMWNAPQRLEGHEICACEAALAMQTELMTLCEQWGKENLPEIRFRIGINTDHVLVGNFGCQYRISYTCLGDGVNLASRLEAANKPFGTTVLVSKNTRRGCGADRFAFRKIGRITVPGKSEVVTIYELLYELDELDAAVQEHPCAETPHAAGITMSPVQASTVALIDPSESNSRPRRMSQIRLPTPTATTTALVTDMVLFHWTLLHRAELNHLVALYEKGLRHYLVAELVAAEQCFLEALRAVPTDGASEYFLGLCRQHKGQVGTAANWDGVIRFDHK